jgi:hypothetical protein
MKTTKIVIENLFGIKHLKLDGKSIEATGKNGTGKTSIIDAIKYGLQNDSERDYIIKQGESEGEIFIETDTGLIINRKKREEKADYKSIKEGKVNVSQPENFLKNIFTELQLNPVDFIQMKKEDQNRIILDLIEFAWDMKYIEEQFGEIPIGIDYEKNILAVLEQIQHKESPYFLKRQDLNREARFKTDHIKEIVQDIPENYTYEKWKTAEVSSLYKQIEKIKDENNKINAAMAYKESFDNKIRGQEAKRSIAISSLEKEISSEKDSLKSSIEEYKKQIELAEEKLKNLDSKIEDKKKVIESEHKIGIEKIKSNAGRANEYANKEIQETETLQKEIDTTEEMKSHILEYERMLKMQNEVNELTSQSEALTVKIEHARALPGIILKTAKIPIEGLTVKDGIPLINNLPVSNLSEGEKLQLCVDIAINKPNSLQIILLDGVEKLSEDNRIKLYDSCKVKGLQFIATRTDNSNELTITTF